METVEFIHPGRSTLRPVSLPQLRPQAALRNRRLARPRQPMTLVEGIEVALVPDGRLDWQDVGRTIDIAFTFAGEVGYLATVVPVVQHLLARADLRVRPDRLDAELAAMAVEAVLAEPVEALEGHLGGEIAFLAMDRAAPRRDLASLSFALHTVADGLTWPGMIHAPAPLLSLLARRWERQPALDIPMDGLAFTLACRVAFTDLAVPALRALAVGDAMLFDRVAVPGGAAVVVAEALHATASFDEAGHLYLSEPFRPPERYALGEFLMTEDDDQDRPVQAIVESAIDELPVRLVFEVGRKDVSLDELRSLAVGSPVPLDRAASSAVQIFANGRRIGSGEMVMIGDQLGVRITQLNGSG